MLTAKGYAVFYNGFDTFSLHFGTGEHCMKYRVLFQQSIRFRNGFEAWSNYGENKRNDKFLSKFVEIAVKYDRDFVKRHYYDED